MKFNRLKLENYKTFREKEIKFTEGVNVILGRNESGKSTIVQALLDVLYRDPSTNSKQFIDNTKSWNTDSLPKLSLNFFSEDNEYSLTKDFQNKTLILENLDLKTQITDFKKSLEEIYKINGITNEQIYEMTAYINQGDLGRFALGQNLFHEITNLGNVDEDSVAVEQVIKQLKQKLVELRKGIDRPAVNPGLIKQSEDNIQKIEKLLEEKRSIWEKRKTASTTKESSDLKLKEIEEQVEVLNELIKNHKIAKSSEKELEEINKSLKTITEKIQIMERINKEEAEVISKLNKLKEYDNPDLENHGTQLLQNEEALKVMRSQLNEISKDVDVTEVPEVKSTKSYKFIGAFAFVTIVTVGAAVIIYLQQSKFLVPLIIIMVGLLCNVGIFIWSRISRQIEKEQALKQEVHESWKELREDNESKIKIAEENIKKILVKYNIATKQEFFAGKAEFTTLKTNLNELKSKKEGLLGGAKDADFSSSQTNLLLEKKEIETTKLTDVVKNSKLTSQQYLEKSRELDKLLIQKKKLENDIVASSTRLQDNEVQYADIIILEEELALAKERRQSLHEKEKAIDLASETMSEAMLQVAKSANVVLKEFVEKRLPQITGGKYSKIKVDSNLSVSVYSKEKNDWVNPATTLSRGTIDQIYLLTRLGFVDILTKGKSTPIILDDPLVTSDFVRHEGIRELLEEASKKYQILFFTNNEYYLDWGNAIEI